MAGSTIVKITVKGKGGHGSAPQHVRDPITAGAYILNNLHTIKSRMVDTFEPFVFSIT